MEATIIIPTFNRWDALKETLGALARVDYPVNGWEVVVIDDGSTDETESIRQWIESADINVRYLRQANAGPAAARNRGAAEARGKVLIFIDNDILVKPDIVRAHVDGLAANPGCWIMGRIVHPPQLRRTSFGRYRDSVWEAHHRAHLEDDISETSGMTAANVSLPAADFHRLGGFDEDFTIASCEDCDLGIRARQAGIRVMYDPRIVALHNDWATSLDTFCERQRLYSISDVLLWRKYGSASPRAKLVSENAPISLSADRTSLIIKKSLKTILSTRLGTAVIRLACALTARVMPDTKITVRAYQTAVGLAIFKGVREGLRRYPADTQNPLDEPPRERRRATESGSARPIICHLIDANVDTSFFRSIARHNDNKRFPVMIGSLAPVGPLQRAMAELRTPTFSLGADERWKYPVAVLRLAMLLRREGVAVIHAHCFDATFVAFIAARIAGVHFVFTRHHSDHNIRLGKHWHTRIDSWCAKRAAHVIAVSEATRRVMMDIEHVPEEQITVVYNGLEPLRKPAVSDLEQLRRELGLADRKVCLMIARLHEEKGHRYLFDAIPEIESRVGPVIFLLAGEGQHRKMLEAEVSAKGLDGVVRFLGRRDDVAELISLASVVALPSLAESFGFVVLEAMSLGTPVVAAATGGIIELVTDGENGLLVPPADSLSLAGAISRVIQNPALGQTLAERGRERVIAFSFEKMILGYEKIYGKIITQSQAARPNTQPSAESAESRTSAG